MWQFKVITFSCCLAISQYYFLFLPSIGDCYSPFGRIWKPGAWRGRNICSWCSEAWAWLGKRPASTAHSWAPGPLQWWSRTRSWEGEGRARDSFSLRTFFPLHFVTKVQLGVNSVNWSLRWKWEEAQSRVDPPSWKIALSCGLKWDAL